jgi:hypothetical protein
LAADAFPKDDPNSSCSAAILQCNNATKKERKKKRIGIGIEIG